jgi:ribosomal protein L16/L10AE
MTTRKAKATVRAFPAEVAEVSQRSQRKSDGKGKNSGVRRAIFSSCS